MASLILLLPEIAFLFCSVATSPTMLALTLPPEESANSTPTLTSGPLVRSSANWTDDHEEDWPALQLVQLLHPERPS